ncbi:MAG: 4-(cytidine 5'-diphospho)-2-C-methyl-D-erythritol kinase, partial [Pseudomonadota bacterium]
AITVVPEITDVLDAVMRTRAVQVCRLSGAGPSAFGIYPSTETAQAAAADLMARHPTWWVRATSLGVAESAPL